MNPEYLKSSSWKWLKIVTLTIPFLLLALLYSFMNSSFVLGMSLFILPVLLLVDATLGLFVAAKYGNKIVRIGVGIFLFVAALWIPDRFSLRAMLIAVTLVALVLGIAAYALRK